MLPFVKILSKEHFFFFFSSWVCSWCIINKRSEAKVNAFIWHTNLNAMLAWFLAAVFTLSYGLLLLRNKDQSGLKSRGIEECHSISYPVFPWWSRMRFNNFSLVFKDCLGTQTFMADIPVTICLLWSHQFSDTNDLATHLLCTDPWPPTCSIQTPSHTPVLYRPLTTHLFCAHLGKLLWFCLQDSVLCFYCPPSSVHISFSFFV